MISQAQDLAERIDAPQRELPTLQEITNRIAAYDSGSQRSDATREAALILLAAAEIGQNVDRLARFTGLRREVVARAARRLVDNAVWREGNTVARWLQDRDDAESFWLDAAVAEGRLCRRVSESGAMEWAPQGYWRKEYEYAGPRGEELSQAVCYRPHVEPRPGNAPLWVPDEEDEAEDEVEQRERAVASEREALIEEPAAAPPVWLGAEEPVEPGEEALSAAIVGGVSPLYLEAVWLG